MGSYKIPAALADYSLVPSSSRVQEGGWVQDYLLTYVRDGGVFCLCGAPSTDLTAALLSTAASHSSTSSMGDHVSRTVRMALVCWITPNIRYIRCLQGIDSHDNKNFDIVRDKLDTVLCVTVYYVHVCSYCILTSAHIPCV